MFSRKRSKISTSVPGGAERELQNADDARATRFELLLLDRGFEPDAILNPLLQGPALVAINDGPFTKKDARNITSITGTSKSQDTGAVGRFGLGQQSVFHLCEAWLYLGHSPGDGLLADVMDPWADPEMGDREYPLWNKFEAHDQSRMREALAQFLVKDSWFVLWLPLRLREHQRKRGGLIEQHFPDVEALHTELSRLGALAQLLPQMGRVRTIHYRRFSNPTQESTHRSAASSTPDLHLSRPEASNTFERSFQGTIDLSEGSTLGVYGREGMIASPELAALQKHSLWPKRPTTEDLEIKEVPEKALPHGAVSVVIDGSPAESPQLHLQWCVFLPLGEEQEILQLPDGGRSLFIHLHGYFFPDHGRRRIVGLDQKEIRANPSKREEVTAAWNQLLRDCVVLPCLLDAMAATVRNLPEPESSNLVRAFSRSKLYTEHRGTICKTHALVCRNPSGQPSWELVSSQTRLLPVPVMALDPAYGLAPLLRQAEGNESVLVRADAPNLTGISTPSGWTRSHFTREFAQSLGKQLNDETSLRILVDLVELIDGPLRALVAADLFRSALCEHGAKIYVREVLVGSWKRLVRSLDPNVVLSTTAPQAIEHLRTLSLNVLILPKDLAPNVAAKLPIDDGRTILEVLSTVIGLGEREAKDAVKLAAEVVVSIGPQIVTRDEQLRQLPVFRVWAASTTGYTSISAARLLVLQERGLAFREKGLVRPHDACRALYQAMNRHTLDVVLCEDEIAGPLDLPLLSFLGLLQPLSSSEPLSVSPRPADREPLLKRLLDSDSGVFNGIQARGPHADTLLRGTRLLLHGDGRHQQDDVPLWTAGEIEGLNNEAVHIVLSAAGDGWRLIPELLAKKINRDWMGLLGIQSLNPALLAGLLRGLSSEQLNTLTRAEEPARIALLCIAGEDASLWRRLPLHVSLDGQRVAADENTWLQNPEWALPSTLVGRAVLIVRSHDPRLLALQERHLSTWSPSAQVHFVLGSDTPAAFVRPCLDALDKLEGGWPESVGSIAWLPTRSGSAVPPRALLDVSPSITTRVAGLLDGIVQAIQLPSGLQSEVTDHAAFPKLLERFGLRGAQVVAALAAELRRATHHPFVLGAAVRRRDVVDEAILCSSLDVLPGWALVRTLHREMGSSAALTDELIPALCRPLEDDALVQILGALSQQARGRSREEKERAIWLFCAFLEEERSRPNLVSAILPRVELLNMTGSWVSAEEIAEAEHNLDPRHRLDPRLSSVLSGCVRSGGEETSGSPGESPPTEVEWKNAASVLRNYFERWITRGVRPEPMGFLVALLGEGADGTLWKLADEWLYPEYAVDVWNRTLLSLTTHRTTSATDIDHEKLRRARYAVRTVGAGQRIRTVSLVGTPLTATLAASGEEDSLFADLLADGVGSNRLQWLKLSPITPSKSIEEHYELLRGSIDDFVQQRLRRTFKPEAFDPFWRKITESGQVQVEAVRRQILEDLPAHLQVLSYKGDPKLQERVTERKRSAQRAKEAESSDLWPQELEARKREAEEAKRALTELVERDSSVQSFLLKQVRRKLDDYKYGPGRVLWELLQNADDAVLQLEEMWCTTEDALPEIARTLKVEIEDHELRVVHWGRPINQHLLGGFRNGRSRGYDLDLLNMMVLNTSEKELEHGTTGCFGLGFKSVYLLTDRPFVSSGTLGFSVEGGLLPKRAEPLARDDEWAQRLAPTVFSLPFREEVHPEEVTAGLELFGGLATLFTRGLRHLVLSGAKGTHELRWKIESVAGVEGATVAVGQVALDAPVTRFLVFREQEAPDRVSVAFQLRDGRFEALPEHIPDLWCTAPTEERWGLGFCIDGRFSLDVGRSQVATAAAGSQKTREVLERAGQLIARGFGMLHAALAEQGSDIARVLGLSSAGDPALAANLLWNSLWTLLSAPLSRRNDADARTELLLHLHREFRGLLGLVRRFPLLPTGLPGQWSALLKVHDVQRIATEELEHREVLDVLAGWTWIDVDPGHLLASAHAEVLQRLSDDACRASSLGLKEVLGWAVRANGAVSLDRAVALSVVVDWFDEDFVRPSTRSALEQDWLYTLRFPTRSTDSEVASGLLVPTLAPAVEKALRPYLVDRLRNLEDEHMRAAFAPAGRVLSEAFANNAEAMRFFFASRSRLQAGRGDDLAGWARAADTPEKRLAVLRYCIRGELSGDLCARLREQKLPWFSSREELRRNSLVKGWPTSDLVTLQNMLFPKEELDPLELSEPIGLSDEAREEFFDNLLRWWSNEATRKDVLAEYERETWPSWTGRGGLARNLKAGDPNDWMVLLVLGASQSIGRSLPAQHRGFLDLLHQRGWWDVFLDPGRPEAWMEALRDWQDAATSELQYSQWMSLFPTIYQLSRYRDVYQRLLQSAGRRPEDAYRVRVLLAPLVDSSLSGSGVSFEAPPAPLNMGLHWVLRELVRLEVIEGEHLWRDCWVPTEGVLHLLEPLGLDLEDNVTNPEKAAQLARFMQNQLDDEWTMETCFDIPLRRVASDSDLQYQLGLGSDELRER